MKQPPYCCLSYLPTNLFLLLPLLLYPFFLLVFLFLHTLPKYPVSLPNFTLSTPSSFSMYSYFLFLTRPFPKHHYFLPTIFVLFLHSPLLLSLPPLYVILPLYPPLLFLALSTNTSSSILLYTPTKSTTLPSSSSSPSPGLSPFTSKSSSCSCTPLQN